MILLLVLQDLNAQDQDEDPMNKLKGQKIVSCRICKGDHWTTRCPYKDTLGPMQKELAEQLGLSTGEKRRQQVRKLHVVLLSIFGVNFIFFIKIILL